MSCCICLEDLNSPVSLPCGHIFCHDCLKRVVQAVQPYSTLHACPTCRAHYYLSPLDSSTVPHHLRPHLTPSIRRVYLDLPPKHEGPDTSALESSRSLSTELARLRAENDALRYNCLMWRKRAEVHSAATLGLLELSRTAKDQIVQVVQQRDTIQKDYLKLDYDFRRQQVILQAMMAALPPQGLGSTSNIASRPPPAVVDQSTVPVFKPDQSITTQRPCPQIDGRSRKRLRTDEEDSNSNATNSHSPPTKFARRSLENNSIPDVGNSAVQEKIERS